MAQTAESLKIIKNYLDDGNESLREEIIDETVSKQSVLSLLKALEYDARNGDKAAALYLGKLVFSDPEEAVDYIDDKRIEIATKHYESLDNGFVYVLLNKQMPETYKVGVTTDTPSKRAKQLSSATGVPYPFEVLYSYSTIYCHEAEKEAHKQLSKHRINEDREFFRCSPMEINEVLFQVINEIHRKLGLNPRAVDREGLNEISCSYQHARNYSEYRLGNISDESRQPKSITEADNEK